MSIIATIVGYASGFALMRLHKPPIDLIATSLMIDAALAPLTAVIAARRGRSPMRWTILGFALGMWALAYVLIVAPRSPEDSDRPQNSPILPGSDSAA
jgi:hypothetical protein